MLPGLQALITAFENFAPVVEEGITLLNAAVPVSTLSPLVATLEKMATDLTAAVAAHKALAASAPAPKV